MRKLSLLPLALLVAACSSAAAPTVAPTATGAATPAATPAVTAAPTASADAYAALAAQLQAELDKQVKSDIFISLSVAVILPDGRIWTGAAGKADVAAGTLTTPDTSYEIASITKTFVATLVLLLAQDGKLSLEDTIGKWLPQLRSNARFMADKVTIRQLLSHTSGISDYEPVTFASMDPNRTFAPEQLLSLVGTPNFAAGTDWNYSNTNYILAGMIAEKAGGAKLASLLHTRLLDPLGLTNIRFQTADKPAAPAAHGYDAITTPGKRSDGWDGSGFIPNRCLASAAGAAGAMTATASDLAKWGAALYGGKVLNAASLQQMLDTERYENLPHRGNYGLGVGKASTAVGTVVGHGGDILYYASSLAYLMDHGVTIAILTNSDEMALDNLGQTLGTYTVRYLEA